MRKIGILLGLITILAYSARPSSAISIVTTAKVFAPDCCYAVTVIAYTTVRIEDVTPAWVGRPITWFDGFDVINCQAGLERRNRSFCCITMPVTYAFHNAYYNQARCPILANSFSEAFIGGNGLPTFGWGDVSLCIAPCRPDCL